MARVSRILIEKDVVVPLRDGTRTVGDLYRPADGSAVPALVMRNPYDREVELRAVSILPSPPKLAERGYAVLHVDVRGRFASEGTFTPFRDEGPDGFDTVEWAAAQSWCNGNVGIFGPSYLGATTILAARERPPSLRCAIPFVTADDYFNDWVYRGGAFQLGFAAGWARGVAAVAAQRLGGTTLAAFIGDVQRAGTGTSSRPLAQAPGVSVPEVAPWWADWLEHDRRDDYWEALSPARNYAEYDVPMLHIGGWWDLFAAGTLRNYQGLRAAGKAPQHLIMGPWAHTSYDQILGDLEFGSSAAAANAGVVAAFNRFIDEHLRGAERRVAPVRYFLVGANEWREADDWPPPDAAPQELYLHSGLGANSARGDGLLNREPPRGNERPDRYLYDPLRPVPTAEPAGPHDQRAIEARDDVLCYTTEALTEPLVLAGPIRLELWAASDAPDTDWTGKLVDVYPDGRAISLADGIVRARYRKSLAAPELLEPGTAERYSISIGEIACKLAPGHRLRLEVSSSNFPRFDPNPNTGRPIATETEARTAVQQVLHDQAHSSRLVITTLPPA